MVHKPIALMILPIFVTGILTLGILAATANAQESNSTGNVAPPQASSNSTGNVAPPQESNSTGNVAPPQTSSNSTGNGPVSQQSSNTRNLRSGPCPYNENITCDNPEPVNNTNTTSTPYVVNKNSSAYLTGYNDAISYSNGACGSLPNTTQVQNDCGNGYVDGIYKVGDPTFQQSADFVKGMLAAHNRERAAVGLPPLVWNDNLAAGAKAWAEHLSPTGELVHDYGNVQGENIANNIANGPREWINEKNCAPNGCERGHYLGMVNPSFTSVGCGTAANPHDIVVCRYSKGIVNP